MRRLDRIVDWSKAAVTAKYNAERLARLQVVSLSQLRRYFLRRFGKPPQFWLDEMRLCRALKVLFEGASVKEAAFELAFCHPSHFCRKFKAYHGCTPGEFIRIESKRQRKALLEFRATFQGEIETVTFPTLPVWSQSERNLLSPIPTWQGRWH